MSSGGKEGGSDESEGHLAMIQRLGDPVPDRRGREDEPCLRFALNRQPDRLWINLFRVYAGSQFLEETRIAFVAGAITVEVPRDENFADLMTALDCFIECANLALPAQSAPAGTLAQ